MAAFFSDLLDEFISPAFLEKVRRKFHYGDTQEAEFYAVAEEMLPLLREEAFWERKEFSPQEQTNLPGAAYEKVVMSLGMGIDCLQDSYSEKGMLSQSYMIEVLASELLMRGYDAYNRYIATDVTNRHVARYYFLGSEEAFPLEMLPQFLQELTGGITCTSAFCMSPKKSVAFVAELTQDENVYCESVCIGCSNVRCPNRIEDGSPEHKRLSVMTDMPLPYGYRRIWGKQ